MNQDYPEFQSRLSRIGRARRDRVDGSFVLREDGLLVPQIRRRNALRFRFPLKGLILAFAVAIAVKAYLIWFLGADLYQAEVLELLNGSPLERVAGQILLPDGLTMWVVTRFEWIALAVTQ